jgi:divalent metal cation (Fe/Co/Zn/Cd) transporter
MLWSLSDREMSAADLAGRVGKPPPPVSQHLAKLRMAHLVRTRREGTQVSRGYTYGFGRVEDLAGLFVLAVIAISAAVAAIEAVHRLVHPVPLSHLGWVAGAGVIGFVGNEIVAVYRITVGKRIGSAALKADGMHARTDGLTSLGAHAIPKLSHAIVHAYPAHEPALSS